MSQISRYALITLILALAVYIASTAFAFLSEPQIDFSNPPIAQLGDNMQLKLISHAGAGLPQGRYSNSLQGLERGYADGLRLFEVDVHLTLDGHPVLLHGWSQDLRQWFHLPLSTWLKSFVSSGDPVMSKAEFMSARMKFGLTQLDIDALAAWLVRRPNAIVELNIKTDAQQTLADFANSHGELVDQIIAEIFDPSEYVATQNLGYRNILWVADDSMREELFSTAERLDLYAIALRLNSPLLSLAPDLNKYGVPLWVYTVNTIEEAAVLSGIGVDGVYTDSLVYTLNE